MATWNSRGLRGSALEELINLTNEQYREKKLALIQKIPTPIKPVEIDRETRHITLAYFDQRSTVDYIGIVQEICICFDAKECAKDTFPMMNIHEHQIKFMEEFEQQGGISFIILYYSHLNETYYIPFRDIKKFYDRSASGGRASFKIDEIDKSYRINSRGNFPVHYLETLQMDLDKREK